MKLATGWKDYAVLATGDGEKLERWGDFVLLRPDPQVIWHAKNQLKSFKGLDGHYIRQNTGGGHWEFFSKLPEEWVVSWQGIKFSVKPMGFKHTGLFPEQAVNWVDITRLLEQRQDAKVLNLFAYTGAASVVCAKAGAKVTHVDASKGMVERAKQNAKLNGIDNIRFIIDDCGKFVEREKRRGNKYDAIILDPPSYGRGNNGETWKMENNIFDFLLSLKGLLSDNPLFVLLSSYTTGLQPGVLVNLLGLAFGYQNIDADEIGLACQDGTILPCGARGLKIFKKEKV